MLLNSAFPIMEVCISTSKITMYSLVSKQKDGHERWRRPKWPCRQNRRTRDLNGVRGACIRLQLPAWLPWPGTIHCSTGARGKVAMEGHKLSRQLPPRHAALLYLHLTISARDAWQNCVLVCGAGTKIVILGQCARAALRRPG